VSRVNVLVFNNVLMHQLYFIILCESNSVELQIQLVCCVVLSYPDVIRHVPRRAWYPRCSGYITSNCNT